LIIFLGDIEEKWLFIYETSCLLFLLLLSSLLLNIGFSAGLNGNTLVLVNAEPG